MKKLLYKDDLVALHLKARKQGKIILLKEECTNLCRRDCISMGCELGGEGRGAYLRTLHLAGQVSDLYTGMTDGSVKGWKVTQVSKRDLLLYLNSPITIPLPTIREPSEPSEYRVALKSAGTPADVVTQILSGSMKVMEP